MAEPEFLYPLPEEESEELEDSQELAPDPATPGPLAVAQPVAVYLQWSLLGAIGGAFALRYASGSLLEIVTDLLPRWSQVAAAAAVAAFLLGMIERAKRDRRAVGYGLAALAAVLAALSLKDDLLAGRAVEPGWFLLFAGLGYGLLHLLCFEDWVTGSRGPYFQHFASASRDLATFRWWFWFSKVAISRRADRKKRQAQLRRDREQEEAARRSAEDRAATASAERKTSEESLVASQAAEQAARIGRATATEQRQAEEVRRQTAEMAELRAAAEQRVAGARAQTEDLNRQAEAAELDRARLKTEQVEAERRFLEAALSARFAAEKAVERGVEAARAQELLDRMQAELARPGTGHED